jgi:two-component system phosphate regulon sensor histidine kinase PhoR
MTTSLYAALLDRLPLPITVVTATGVIMYRNRTFDEAFGAEADSWLRNAALSLGGERGWLHGFFADYQDNHSVEMEFGGRLYRIEKIMAEPLDQSTVALQFDDITRQAEIEQSKSDFTSMIVHDLRGPLSGIQATLDFVLNDRERFGPMHEDLLKEAYGESGRMMNLINEILDFSKIQSGRYTVDYEPVRLAGMLKRAVLSLQAIAVRNEVVLLSAHTSDLPTIEGSVEKLTQAVINLVSNALKFTPRGGVISVGCQAIPDQRHPQHVAIMVSDTGVGISDEDLGRLFQRYEQGGSRAVRGEAGTGLGLYIVKEIAEAHGGSLEVASVQGVGTSVVMCLPVQHQKK